MSGCLKVLIVDDSLIDREIVKAFIDRKFDVTEVSSGNELFENIEDINPDIILMDVMMPDMDGCETLRRLRSTDTFKDIPVIFITALHDSTLEEEYLPLTNEPILKKPFLPEEIIGKIETVLADHCLQSK